jgi:ribonucleoside-diphosphate reductase alpha chain
MARRRQLRSGARGVHRDRKPVCDGSTTAGESCHGAQASRAGWQVIRRNGKVTHFDPNKIKVAMTKAFLAVEGGSAAASSRIHDRVEALTEQVASALTRRLPGGGTVHIEDIQDQVELALMRAGEHKVARDYVLYREARARERAEKAPPRAARAPQSRASTSRWPTAAPGRWTPSAWRGWWTRPRAGSTASTPRPSSTDTLRNLFDGVKEADVSQALVMSARAMIEREPAYSQAAARLLLDIMRREALGFLDMAWASRPRPTWASAMRTTSRPTSSAPATWNCWTSSSGASTSPASAPR